MVAISTEELDDAVNPELKSAWEREKMRWFADDTPEKQKTPGYLKEEFSSKDGLYIGLTSKCYIAKNVDNVKRSQKGTPRHLGRSVEEFENCLFQNTIPRVKYHSIQRDVKHNSCVTKEVTKRALNPVYVKHKVSDNLVDISPFKNENGYV